MEKRFFDHKLFDRLKPVISYVKLLGIISIFSNLLMLVPPIYMIQAHRAVNANSKQTLLALTVIMIVLLIAFGILEWVRGQLLQRASARFFQILAPAVFRHSFDKSVSARGIVNPTGALDDLQGVRRFLASRVILGFFDAPYVPLFIFILFLMHPYVALFAIFGAVVLVSLTFANERLNRADVNRAQSLEKSANIYAERNLLNAEVAQSMGMYQGVQRRWQKDIAGALSNQVEAGARFSVLAGISRSFRMMLQSCTLGLAAYLIIDGQLFHGAMIACVILLSRTISPIDQISGAWGQIQTARGQFLRLMDIFERDADRSEKMSLPEPQGRLRIEQLYVNVPRTGRHILKGLTFSLRAGAHLGVIGPSGAGKSTLGKALMGVAPAARGSIRLDDVDLASWDRIELGPSVGYLPQEVELFDGTVAENIARFGEFESEEVVAAARRADIHDLILHLPQGYDTSVSALGGILSGGQRQRIGLARALFGDPRFVVLDEPNANLDVAGEQALLTAIKLMKTNRVTLIVIAHNARVLSALDNILVLNEGSISAFGSSKDILDQYMRPKGEPSRLPSPPPAPEPDKSEIRAQRKARRQARAKRKEQRDERQRKRDERKRRGNNKNSTAPGGAAG